MQAQRHDNAAFCDVHLNKHHCLLALRRTGRRQYYFPFVCSKGSCDIGGSHPIELYGGTGGRRKRSWTALVAALAFTFARRPLQWGTLEFSSGSA